MPAKVNPVENTLDLEVLYAGASGRSTKFIQELTPYSQGQVLYRLKKDGIKRRKARDGETDFSRMMYERGRELFLQLEMQKIRRRYKYMGAKKAKKKR